MQQRPTLATLVEAIAGAARSIDQPDDLDARLRDVSAVARTSVPEFDHVSVTLLHPDGRFSTRAPTSELALQLDAAQYDEGQGPCLDTARDGVTLTVPHLELERRWPAYTPHAVARGVQCHLSVALLLVDTGTRGSLNLYSTTVDRVTRDSVAMAELIGSSLAPGTLRTPGTAPGPASEHVQVIGQALRVVSDARGLDADSAFDHLDRDADRADLSLYDHAKQVVDQHRLSR